MEEIQGAITDVPPVPPLMDASQVIPEADSVDAEESLPPTQPSPEDGACSRAILSDDSTEA
jgi:hypothetical protein